MESEEAIKKFKDFLEETQKERIIKANQKGRHWIRVPFMELAQHDPDLADFTLENPKEAFSAVEVALETFSDNSHLNMRMYGLPKDCIRNIWEIRGKDVGKFISIQGIINKSSDIFHECEAATYSCHDCGRHQTVLILDGVWKKPKACLDCGKQSKWILLDREMKDSIKVGIMDDMLEGNNKDRSIAREKIAILSKDLTDRLIDRQIKPGRKVIINGFMEYRQTKKEQAEFTTLFNANYIEFVKVGWETITISKSEEEEFKVLAKSESTLNGLAESIADVKGYPHIKQACLLMLAGAPTIYDKNKLLDSRGTIHVLLIGNPGSAKTFLAKRAGAISPINSFQSAATASGKGLVASVGNDKEVGCWVVYPGVVPMCHKGVVVIDEIDKTHEEDYGDHNNAMNDMEVMVAKASAKARLDTETSYLATANPENRVFTPHETYYKQINMPKDFLDRFDIVFPMVVSSDENERGEVLQTMLERHLDGESKWNPKFSHEYIQKYIAYCRRFVPKVSEELFQYIKEKVNALMKPREGEQANVSFRQLESIMRFAYASARLRLVDVDKKALDIAFELKRKSFYDLQIIDEHGTFDWAKVEDIDEERISHKERIKQTIKELDKGELIDIQDVVEKCQEWGIDQDVVENQIELLKKRGDYFEPINGKIKKM